jgi:hypothetical protein
MTCESPSEARDDVYTLIVNAWGDEGPVDYEDKPRNPNDDPIPPKEQQPWIRIKMEHTFGRQVTLANEIGQRRFRKFGVITVQLFCPLGSSLREPERLGILLNNALEGASTPHDVLFRNVRMNEEGSDGHWFQVNVIADFEYDSVR